MAAKKTSKAKAKDNTKAIDTNVAITITEDDADKKRKQTHADNMAKVAQDKGGYIQQGKPLNNKSYEYACNDCLDKVVSAGDIFCLEELPLAFVGRCNCGKLTTNKAILI